MYANILKATMYDFSPKVKCAHARVCCVCDKE